MQVTELIPGKRAGWRCVEGPEEWVGTELTFDLSGSGEPSGSGGPSAPGDEGASGGETVVLFTQAGWREPVPFMHHCSTKWAVFLQGLNRHNGQTLRELCSGLDMARQSVSKHLAILEDARLVTRRTGGPARRSP